MSLLVPVLLKVKFAEKQLHRTHTCTVGRQNPVLSLQVLPYYKYRYDKDRHPKVFGQLLPGSLPVLLVCKPGCLQLETCDKVKLH